MKCFYCDIMRHLFIRPSVETEPADIIFSDKGQDCFLITDSFHMMSWFSTPLCTSLSSCSIRFFSVSFHVITHTFWTNFWGFLCKYGLYGIFLTYGMWWKLHVNNTVSNINIFTEKNNKRFWYLYYMLCVYTVCVCIYCVGISSW